MINDSTGHKRQHEPRQECVKRRAENHVESPFHPTSREMLSVKNVSDSLDELDSSQHPISNSQILDIILKIPSLQNDHCKG